jgi:hypothetical protein
MQGLRMILVIITTVGGLQMKLIVSPRNWTQAWWRLSLYWE